MQRVLTLAATIIAALSLLVAPAAAQTYEVDAEQAFLDAINASRSAEGLPALVMNAELQGIARGWTDVMNRDDDLKHNPSYAEQYTGQWNRMGENVGYTRRNASNEQMVAVLHQAFMDSPGHRANILGAYNQAGIGVVRDGNTMWVTVNFLDGEIPQGQVERVDSQPAAEEQAQEEEVQEPQRRHYEIPRGERSWGRTAG